MGSMLVGVALALVVIGYVTRPFRRARELDAAVEAWIAREAAALQEDARDAG